MNLKIVHTTQYNFTSNIFLEPHYLRFKPKIKPYLKLNDFEINISPSPTGISEFIDAEDNRVILCWFEGLHGQLEVEAVSTVKLSDFNPFDFIVYPAECNNLPFQYDKATQKTLSASLAAKVLPGEMLTFVDKIRINAKNNTIQFLGELTRKIHQNFSLKERERGNALSPEVTFANKIGSCRDLAWMQIQMLRNLGIAARFVSGYFYIQSEEPGYELHGWVEAYIPGGGWVGLDPSHGIFTEKSHIPVSSSAFYEFAMPVFGSIRGDAGSTLSTKLEIHEV